MKSKPFFSVIIPTYNRNDLLAKCLDCLALGAQTLSKKQYEVIVTDDGSKTTAKEMIKKQYPWAKWVQGPRKGPAANRNNGTKYSRGEWLVFTDDDCQPDQNWLKAFKNSINKTILALEGSIHPVGNPNQDLAKCPTNLTGGWFWSANIAIKRTLFKKVGGFDPNYFYPAHEDQDLKIRLSLLTTILFVPEACVYHPAHIISLKKAIINIPKECAAWGYHIKKHGKNKGYKNNLNVILNDYKSHLRVLLKSMLKFHFKQCFIEIIWTLIGIPLIWIELSKLDRKSKN